MSSSSRTNYENRRASFTCMGWSRQCAIHTFVLAISTSIFVTLMILSAYLTSKTSLDKMVVVQLVGSCLLYLLGFFGHMYSIYYDKPRNISSENGETSNWVSETTRATAQSSFTNRQLPSITYIPQAREPFRITPPPPYEVQMSEMSRMLLPGPSRTTQSSTRELEIAEEARKLIKRMYEEIRMTDQQVSQSPNADQPVQQVVMRPKTPLRQHKMLSSKASLPNLVVQRQQTPVKRIPSQGLQPAGSGSNLVFQQKEVMESPMNQFDLERLIISSDGCSADHLQQSPMRQDLWQIAHKRKLICHSKDLHRRSQITRNTTNASSDLDTQNNEYEEIETLEGIQNTNSSQTAYEAAGCYVLETELENPSASSTASELGLSQMRRQNRNQSRKKSRRLSAASTRKFRHLGKSPETVLDAIATCFDLTPDEWMVAWKLNNKGVPTNERARILGIRLHDADSEKLART